MILTLLAVCELVTICGFLWLVDRHQHRAWRERENDRQERARLNHLAGQEAAAYRAEIQTLLQWIQAPEAAVVEHQQQHAGDSNPYPLTEEEQVEAQDERLRLVAEIERMEREGGPLQVHFPGDQ